MLSANGYFAAMDSLIETIREEFRKSGRSMKSVAEEAGLGYGNVHRIINTTDRVSLATADKVCRVLGLKLVASRKRKR